MSDSIQSSAAARLHCVSGDEVADCKRYTHLGCYEVDRGFLARIHAADVLIGDGLP
jgi:hypothetical protein